MIDTGKTIKADGWLLIWDQPLTDLLMKDGSEAKSPWHAVSQRWREAYLKPLDKIDAALYVLSISKPFTFAYPKGHSHVFYVGEGMAHRRFRAHIKVKMLPWLESLTQARFDFHVLPCGKDKEQAVASERVLLEAFETKYGRKPYLNIQSGKKNDVQPHPEWRQPIDGRRHVQRRWALTPLD